jgi:hypothetical protein
MLLRDASRTPTVLGLDAKFVALIFPVVFHIRLWTILYAVLVVVFFVVLKVKKMEIRYAYRKVIKTLRGRTVYSRPWWFLKKWRNR